MSCTTPYTDPCGCQFQLDTKCVFYNSDNLTCLEVDSGSDLETILKAIDAKICTLNPDTPIVYNVRNLDGTITVVPTGTNPRVFTVSLSGTFLNRITNIEGDITVIQDFINNLSFATTTPGMTGSVTGNVITVNYTNPTTATKHGGIIYSDNTRTALVANPPTTGFIASKGFYNVNYLNPATYDLKVGEQIKIKSTFRLPYLATTNYINKVSLAIIGTPTFYIEFEINNDIVNAETKATHWYIQTEVDITCTSLDLSVPNASITGRMFDSFIPTASYNGQASTYFQGVAVSSLHQVNWSTLSIGTSVQNSSPNYSLFNDDFSVEIIKLF